MSEFFWVENAWREYETEADLCRDEVLQFSFPIDIWDWSTISPK